MTQREVADRLGVGQSTYKNYEGGLREPNGDTMVVLANMFHVTTDYLLGRNIKEQSLIDRLSTEFDMSLLEKKFAENYLDLSKEKREDFMSFLARSVDEVRAEVAERNTETTESEKGNSSPTIAEDIAATFRASDSLPNRINTK